MKLLLNRKVIIKQSSANRENLLYEVLMKIGMSGFVKKFNFERQARPLMKYDDLYK